MADLSRRRFLELSAAGSVVGLFGCQGGTPSILGYQLGTDALYDQNIKSVFVHTFYNRTLETTPFRGIEVEITEEIVRQIPQKTPFKVLDVSQADTELIGKLVGITKNELNLTQQNQVREGEVVLAVDVVWRDLRTGKILSAPRKRRNPGNAPGVMPPDPFDAPPAPFDENVPVAPPESKTPPAEPVRLIARGRYIPELGESNTTGYHKAILQLANQITVMMQKRW
jgi:hypothetical protein